MKKSLKQSIIKRLTSNEWTSRRLLNARLNLVDKYVVSDRHMRNMITKLRKKDGYLIASSSKGYKLIQSRNEFESHIKYKRSYAMNILKECKLMERNFKRETKPQLFA